MLNEYLIKNFCKFTKIKENDINNYFKDKPKKELRNIIEHPESLNLTVEQSEKLNALKELNNLYTRVTKYKDYVFDDTIEMADFLKSQFTSKHNKEQFMISLLDKGNKLLGTELISIGTLNASIVHPRDVFKEAIKHNASKVVLCHNHPSGDPTPSDEDIRITNRLESVGKMLGIDVIDHIIIGRENYYSFKKELMIFPRNYKAKTESIEHEKLFKEDVKNFINKLNKVTKIPKKELKEILNNISIKELIDEPKKYLSKEDYVNKINALKNLSSNYINSTYFNVNKINSPDSVLRYVEQRYSYKDEVDVVLLLDTKNQIIDSIIVPENISEYEKFKHIMQEAIKYDSNSIILSSKVNDLKETHTNHGRGEGIRTMKFKSEEMGIKILDNVDICNSAYISYKEKNYFREDSEEWEVKEIETENEWEMEM